MGGGWEVGGGSHLSARPLRVLNMAARWASCCEDAEEGRTRGRREGTARGKGAGVNEQEGGTEERGEGKNAAEGE